MNDLEKKVADENQKSNESGENFEFVTETIKRRPINKKKILNKILFTIALAIVFGVVASLTLILLYPRLQNKFYPENDTKPVTLPVAQEELVEEPVEEFIPPKEDADDIEKIDNSVIDNNDEISKEEKEDIETSDEQNKGDSEISSELEKENSSEENVVINQVVETIEKSLELDDYKALLRKESAVATAVSKSLVTVSGRSSDKDWFNNSYESKNVATGLIVANNGKELLVLCPTDILNKATSVEVTFCDGTTSNASIRKSDTNTKLFIVSVLLSNISEETMEEIELVQFGSLAASDVGIPVVAVGSPYGTPGSVGFGQITSNSTLVDKTDSNIHLISTDIYGSPSAAGALVNLNGRIVGIICHESAFSDMSNIIHAYAIADIIDSIEKISNGESIPMLGIYGTDVTEDANEEYGVPMGAYVKEVVVDSPAMNVGIRNGDVIDRIGDDKIESFTEFKEVILKHRVGDVLTVTIKRPLGENYTIINYDVTLEALK